MIIGNVYFYLKHCYIGTNNYSNIDSHNWNLFYHVFARYVLQFFLQISHWYGFSPNTQYKWYNNSLSENTQVPVLLIINYNSSIYIVHIFKGLILMISDRGKGNIGMVSFLWKFLCSKKLSACCCQSLPFATQSNKYSHQAHELSDDTVRLSNFVLSYYIETYCVIYQYLQLHRQLQIILYYH